MRFVLASLFALGACTAPRPALQTAATPSLVASANVAAPPTPCPLIPVQIGRISEVQLNEVSGVVESRQQPAVLFVHNDSGDSPRFFAIARSGQVLAELVLEGVPLLLDAEDIAIGRGPGGGNYVYLGDTGNNFAAGWLGIPRRKAVLQRMAEPAVSLSARHVKVPVRDVFSIVLTFPRGARNVEAFFIDPISGDLFMLGKQPDGVSQLLSASAAMLAAGGGELRWLGELHFGRGALPGSPLPTGADISADGSTILVRTYSSVFLFGANLASPCRAR